MGFSSKTDSKADVAPHGSDLLARQAGPGVAASAEPGGRGLRLVRLLESSPLAFAALDLSGRIVAANRPFASLVDLDDDAERPHELAAISPPGESEKLADALRRVLATRMPVTFEMDLLGSDRREVSVEIVLELDQVEQTGETVGFCAFAKDLTRRRKVLAALRDSEERFRRLYDEAPIGYHEVDAEGRIVSINRTECEILGYTREEMVGRPYFDFLAEEVRERARAAFPDKIEGNRPLTPFERTVLTRDGRRLVIAIEERYQRDEQGRVVGLLSTMRDVTSQKRAEEALVAAERRNRALFEGMDEAAFVHTAEGRIVDANPAAARLLGYTHAELLTMSTRDIDEPDFGAGFDDRVALQFAVGHLTCEGRHRTKDGRVIPVEINTSIIQYDGAQAVLALLRDISERTALEETRRAFAEAQARNAREMAAKNAELTLSEARYRQLTEGCLDGVVAVDRGGRITLFNPAAERMFGFGSGEVVGLHLGTLMPEAFPERAGLPFDQDVLGRKPEVVGKTGEFVGARNTGERFPVELSLSVVTRDGVPHFIGSVRDQTERQRMRAMLAQTERLASIGLLSAGVTHEINNPLAYVANNLAVLSRDLGSLLEMVALYEECHAAIASAEPERAARIAGLSEEFDWPYVRENLPRMIARTSEGVQRVATIVSKLRGLARTSPPKLEATPIRELFEGAVEMIRGRLRRGRIEAEFSVANVPALICDPPLVGQVILNLMMNATEAIESCGRPDGGTIQFSARVEGDMMALTVRDNGCGIDPDDFDRLFDPFFTTKTLGEGTGLGLWICHNIVTGHGGRINFESQPGAGTAVHVLLPLKPT